MSLAIFQSLPIKSKVSLVTLMQVSGYTRFRGYEFMGLIPYEIARSMATDPQALVAATRAYFRPGSETQHDKITYVAMRKDQNSALFLIPEPLVQAGSVEVTTKTTTFVTIDGEYSQDEISIILSSNGITNFTIRQEFVG